MKGFVLIFLTLMVTISCTSKTVNFKPFDSSWLAQPSRDLLNNEAPMELEFMHVLPVYQDLSVIELQDKKLKKIGFNEAKQLCGCFFSYDSEKQNLYLIRAVNYKGFPGVYKVFLLSNNSIFMTYTTLADAARDKLPKI